MCTIKYETCRKTKLEIQYNHIKERLQSQGRAIQ